MSLDALLSMERERYVTFLKKCFRVGKGKYETSVTELLIKMNSEKFKDLPEVFQLMRLDLIYKTSDRKDGVYEYNIDSLLNYSQEEFKIGKLKVTIKPFVWNGCELSLNKQMSHWNRYYDWAIKWIDIDDKIKSSEDEIEGKIHSVTYPIQVGNNWETSIDLGTAPIGAIKELFAIFEEQGVEELTLDSKFIKTKSLT